jgi:hypothetical protein
MCISAAQQAELFFPPALPAMPALLLCSALLASKYVHV